MTLTAAHHACRCGSLLTREPTDESWSCPKAPGPLDEPAPTDLVREGAILRLVTMSAKEWCHTQGVPADLVPARL